MRRQPARSVPTVKKLDGRHARKTRTAEAILSALHALLEEGVSEPTASQIAERADVAVRSIGQHFRSREHLLLALAAFHAGRVPEPAPLNLSLPFDDRLSQFVAARCQALEHSATMRKAAREGARGSKAIARALGEVIRRRRDELRRAFAAELKGKPEWLTVCAELLASGSTWDALRHEQHLSLSAAQQVVLQALRHLLAP